MKDEGNETNSKPDFTATTYIECKTGGGQFVEFKCRPKNVEEVKQCAQLIHSIRIPETSELSVDHGCYGRYTRFVIKQHKYAGNGWPGCGGFIEVLEIKNPPEGRCGTIIHEENSGKSTFHEFRSMGDALEAYKKFWSLSSTEKFSKEKGFIRRVNCGLLNPWFYAVGNQAINGDFTFPDRLDHNHPIYWTGRKVKLVTGDNTDTKEEEIKICWGTATERHKDHYDRNERTYLTVQFSDGTTWSEYGSGSYRRILPLNETDLLKEKILDAVRNLLNGEVDKITVFSESKKITQKITIESQETNKPIGYYFTSGIQQMIDETGKQKEEITFVIQSEEETAIGNEEFLEIKREIEDLLLVEGDDYDTDEDEGGEEI